MFKARDISIKNKLVLMQVFTSVLVLSIFSSAFILTEISSYKQRKVNSILALAQVISNNSISTIEFQSAESADKILSELNTAAPEIIHAAILDTTGKTFAQYTKAGETTKFVIPAFTSSRFLFIGDQLFVKDDIIDDNIKLGTVVLEVNLYELQEIKQSRYQMAAMLLFIALSVAVLVAFIVQGYISRRLLKLVNTIQTVKKTGEYDTKIIDTGQDEISILTTVYNDLMEQVKENQHKKDEFIGIASHELKTPLTSIKGYLQVLNLIEDKQPNKQCVEKALENVNKLERLIKDLLDVSKIQSGQLELNIAEVDINNVVDESIAIMRMLSPGYNIKKLQGLNNVLVDADRQRIEQVMINLLSNAVKYSPGQNEILVQLSMTETDIVVAVKDFGIGIAEEEHQHIFKRFYRTREVGEHISGFGLGLYICQDIIQRHNGKLWVKSEEKGSCFYFSLPKAKSN